MRAAPARTPLRDVLRQARVATGLTFRAFATRCGLSVETVRAAERGSDVTHSTLMAYLAACPELRASQLLGGRSAAPASSPAAWKALRELFGFATRRLRVTLHAPSGARARLRIEASGVAPCNGELTPSVIDALTRAIAVPSLGGVKVASAWTRVARAEPWHACRLRRGGKALDYRAELDAEATDTVEHVVGTPVEHLELVVIRPGMGRSLLGHARPSVVAPEAVDPDLARLMYPKLPPPVRTGRQASWRVEKPLPGFTYGVSVVADDPPGPRRLAWSLAGTLRRAREAAGLSTRDVARAGGISHASVTYAERGRDSRASTLEAYMGAVRGLAAQEVLPATSAHGSLSRDACWELMRDIYGYEIRLLRKTCTIAADGTASSVVSTVGLQPLRDDLSELRVRTGLQLAVSQASRNVMKELSANPGSLKIRELGPRGKHVLHEFRFPTRLTGGSMSHRRTFEVPQLVLRRSQMTFAPGADNDAALAISLPIHHPVERAEIVIVLPATIVPRWTGTTAWCALAPPIPNAPHLASRLQPPRCRERRRGAALILKVSVLRPVLGTSPTILVGLPD